MTPFRVFQIILIIQYCDRVSLQIKLFILMNYCNLEIKICLKNKIFNGADEKSTFHLLHHAAIISNCNFCLTIMGIKFL